jgi:hypothetical protein
MANDLERRLKRRFREFLSFHRDEVATAFRSSIREVLDRVVERGWRAYIVGGTLRDVMLAPPSVFPRDVDLVVSGPSEQAFESTFEDLISRRTRFDGLHLVKRFSYGGISRSRGEVLFDVWRLPDTWGIRSAGLPPTIESFVRTPFLNIDSVAIALAPRNAQRQVAECGFFDSLSTRTLEINFAPNPFPLVCIVRSLIMAAKLRFSLGRSLAQYIVDHSPLGSVDALFEAQVSHYGRDRCSLDELGSWLKEVRAGVNAGLERVDISITRERQLELWKDRPLFLSDVSTLSRQHGYGQEVVSRSARPRGNAPASLLPEIR